MWVWAYAIRKTTIPITLRCRGLSPGPYAYEASTRSLSCTPMFQKLSLQAYQWVRDPVRCLWTQAPASGSSLVSLSSDPHGKLQQCFFVAFYKKRKLLLICSVSSQAEVEQTPLGKAVLKWSGPIFWALSSSGFLVVVAFESHLYWLTSLLHLQSPCLRLNTDFLAKMCAILLDGVSL